MSPLTWLRQHDPGLRASRRAARVAIVMPLLFAFGSQVVRDVDVATFGPRRALRGQPVRARGAVAATPGARVDPGGAASRRLDDAFREYLAEHGRKQSDLATVTALVTGVVAPRLAADAVLALWEREDGSRSGDRSVATHELGRDAHAVAGWYAQLGEALVGGSAPPEATGRDVAGDERLVVAVRRDLDDGTGMRSPTAVRMIRTGDHLDALRRLQPALLEPAASPAPRPRVSA